MAVLGVGAASAVAGGVYAAATQVNWESLPIISSSSEKNDNPGGGAGPTVTPARGGATVTPAQPIGQFDTACKDSRNSDCRAAWAISGVAAQGTGVAVKYQLKITGLAGCSVGFPADKDVLGAEQQAGKPGPFLEGAQGRLYALVSSDGFLASGGNAACDATQAGTWNFAPAPGEQSLKLRYPGLPPFRIDLTSPVTGRNLPNDDQVNILPADSANCTTVDNQACRATWEIGPYGTASDGSALVYFAVRYQGPANCQVNWQADLEFSKAAVGRGERGILLETGSGPGLVLAATGGVASFTGPLACGAVHFGSWRFANGTLPQNVNLVYPDLPLLKIPIKP
jgi:hypothetical protein